MFICVLVSVLSSTASGAPSASESLPVSTPIDDTVPMIMHGMAPRHAGMAEAYNSCPPTQHSMAIHKHVGRLPTGPGMHLKKQH